MLRSLRILAALSALAFASTARAQQAAPQTQSAREAIDEIVVTGTRRPVPISQIGSTVTLVDDAALRLDQARDFAEILREVPGVTLVRSGSRGGATSLFVRGGADDHNLILIDGVQVNRAGGAFDLSTLSTDGLERVEIVRGPASAIYGSDAVASVIHLITRRGEGPMQGSVRALAGSDDTYEVGTSLSGGSERFGYSVSAGRYVTDGLDSLNNDADNTALRTRFDYEPTESLQIKLTGAYTDSAFDNPTDFVFLGGFPPIDPDQGRETHELSSGVELTWQASERFEHRFSIGHADSEDIFFDGFDPEIGSDFDDSRSDTDEDRTSGEYRVLWSALSGPGARAFVTLGYEYERERFDQRSRSIFAGIRTQDSTTERRRTSAGYLQTDWVLLDDVFVTLGARLDDNSEFGSELSPLGSIAWVLPSSGTRLHAALSRGIKEPTFGENFGFPGFADGNAGLDPETSKSAEIGVDQSFLDGVVQTSLTFFRTDYDELIAFISPADFVSPSGAFGTFDNVQDVRSQGIEAELRIALTPELRLSANYTRLRTRVRDAGEAASVSFAEGEELLRRPTHSGSLSLAYTAERLEGRLSATLLGPREDRDDRTDPASRFRNDERLTVDVAASYLVSTSSSGTQTRLVLRAENLLDDEDEEILGFESPDFTVLAGVELRF
jgi:vitamin B12 transporter